ncbi:hypothetical protein RvY_18962 [Ramazzottius varieornatus]|uniref:Uncharacterized protein n=1 Tax=Ramazzottius varieornatus TaxID=947166 RepID=A0A1D1W7P9_RAMVA|nr:hypothetical protein RvY_18962 [Ramazzottius varieornatus]
MASTQPDVPPVHDMSKPCTGTEPTDDSWRALENDIDAWLKLRSFMNHLPFSSQDAAAFRADIDAWQGDIPLLDTVIPLQSTAA